MVELPESEERELQRYLSWDEKRLFRELDRYYGASSPGGKRAAYSVRGKGRVWLKETWQKLEAFVCDEWDYPARKSAPELQDKERLAAELSQALSPLLERNPFPTGAQVPSHLVAAILLQSGLDQLCE
ncbi:MAG: hypothetical protein OEV76_06440, partial [Anaerolineae bacterium]|nr:hypothetical protein [Anaerolineae bacterium]